MSYANDYLAESGDILAKIDGEQIECMVDRLRQAYRVFVCGLGGSAATASHAVNDLRKLCRQEAHCPSDNAAEMLAYINDDSWGEWLSRWLHGQTLNDDDAVLFLSVGGGDLSKNVSVPLVMAARFAASKGAAVLAIVGRDGGELERIAGSIVRIPNMFPERVTPHVEGLTSVILHCLVSHPKLQCNPTKW